MKRRIQFAGIVGSVLLFFGIFTASIAEYDWYHFVPVHLVIGVLLLVIFLLGGGIKVFKTLRLKHAAGASVRVSLYSVSFIGVMVIANYLAARHQFVHFDTTREKVYSLAPQTVETLKALATPLVIRGFYLGGKANTEDVELIQRMMRRFPDKVKWQLIDPEQKPQLVNKYGVTEAPTLHLSLEGEAPSREQRLIRDRSEQAIVNAILQINRQGAKIVYYLQGHGEPGLDDRTAPGFNYLLEAAKDDSIEIRRLELKGQQLIPNDATAVLIVAGSRPMLATEFSTIENYLQSGGKALMLHEPRTNRDIANLVLPYGVAVEEDVIVDELERAATGPGYGVQPVVKDFASHEITARFKGRGTLLFTVASSVHSRVKNFEFKRTELAKTSQQSWGEKNVELIFSDEPKAAREGDDFQGPVPVAVTVEPVIINPQDTPPRGPTRMVVIGDRDFASNAYIQQVYNRDFFLNSLNWVIGDEAYVTIRPRSLRLSKTVITTGQFNTIFILTGVLLPEVLLIGGLAVWWSRRE